MTSGQTSAEKPEAADGSREDFEAFMRWSRASEGRGKLSRMLLRSGEHDYLDDSTQRHWWTWQHARTALLAARLFPPMPAASGSPPPPETDKTTAVTCPDSPQSR